jgi:2-polyprenyl-6-methoxyphenol hydroxylase-like FAD-dependent oxidoreductase
MHAVIVGAGIGGLAAAVALRRVGFEVTVIERAAEIREVGAGLSIWANAVKALRELGIEQQVVHLGSIVDRVKTVPRAGNWSTELVLPEAGAPSICVHRGKLQHCLLEQVPLSSIRTGTSCTGYRGSAALLEDGSSCEGDLLIAADGIDSAIRAQIHGGATPRYAGYTCWRGMTQDPGGLLPPGTALTAGGRGTQIGLFPCGPGQLYWFVTKNTPPAGGFGREELLSLCRDWPPPIPQVIASTQEVLRNDVVDRPPLDRWGEGSVTLLGDAAHSTTPNLGQGACQALEDAVVLADSLRKCTSIEAGLRLYERLRIPRANFVVRESWRLGRMLQTENPIAEKLRDWGGRTWLGRRMTSRLFQQLLTYDVPRLPG